MRPLYGYTWDGVGGPRDPRIVDGAVAATRPEVGAGQMDAKDTPRYALGEAELGDLHPDGDTPAPVTLAKETPHG